MARVSSQKSSFQYLFRDGLQPSTIISHRTSVASVLRHWVYNPVVDPHIKLLVRAFRLEHLVQRRIMPKWDLHLVLLSLLRPPFTSQSEEDGESSDDVIPLKWRMLKCVFLLALASARRRLYLHALSIAPGRCVFARGNTQRQLAVSLLLEPGFLAKNQLPMQAPEWIMVPGIAHLNPKEPERMLCPVRQLKLDLHTGLWKNPGWAVSECSFTGTAASGISWGATLADGSWRLSRKPTLKLFVSTTVWQRMRSERFQLHGHTTVRWLYLTSCQRHFGGHLGSSRIRTCATWLVVLRACRHWVQWWLHNT